MSSGTTWPLVIPVTPGLESLLQLELQSLGLAVTGQEPGVVLCSGDWTALWTVALRSRLAEGLRVRLGRPQKVTGFGQLKTALRKLPWAAYLQRSAGLPKLAVSARKSRLYHSDAIAERAAEVLRERLGASADGDTSQSRVFLRMSRDKLQVSIDAIGEPLHRRGYRQHIGRAPLRETLAASLLALAGYAGERPLCDPFCGSGTIPLEAASLAAGWVPGLLRQFAFERWPVFERATYDSYRESLAMPVDSGAPIAASDLEPAAVEAAKQNQQLLEQGLARTVSVKWQVADATEVVAQLASDTLIVSNLPYGVRLARHQRVIKQFLTLVSERELAALVMLGDRAAGYDQARSWRVLAKIRNRGIPVRVLASPAMPSRQSWGQGPES